MMMKRRSFAILFVLIIDLSYHVKAFVSSENQHQKHRQLLNIIVDAHYDENDEYDVVNAAKWRTITSNQDIRKSRDQTKCSSRSLTETEVVMTCNKKKPCPDPTENDWIQDRCEAIFATIGTIWAYCTSSSSSLLLLVLSSSNNIAKPFVYNIHQVITFLSMKIQNIARSVFVDTIRFQNYNQNSYIVI